MIFDTPHDILIDVKNKISNYLADTSNDRSNIDINNIISLLRNYLNELKNIHEIRNWDVDNEPGTNNILVIIYTDKRMHYFEMDLSLELRKLKIVRIQENGEKNKST